jgi:hypothetical protein
LPQGSALNRFNLAFDLHQQGLTVEWHPKLSHFEENLHSNLSQTNGRSCSIFEQGIKIDKRLVIGRWWKKCAIKRLCSSKSIY